MTEAGLLDRRIEPGTAAAQRAVLNLNDVGRSELQRRLAHPADQDVTDPNRWMTLLAFLSLLPDVADQHAVLRRRLEFLERPASFFYDEDRPLRAEDVTDPYRRGMFVIARVTSRAERAWLHEVLGTPAAS